MEQLARNATIEGTGYLNRCRYLLHDRDTKFCREFRGTLAAGGAKCSPDSTEPKFEFLRGVLGTFGKRGVPRLILFGEQSLRRAVSNFLEHFHHERNHQRRGNLLSFPTGTTASATQATAVRCHERLGGLLKYYSRAA